MIKQHIENNNELNKFIIEKKLELNKASIGRTPKSYPCVVVAAYAGDEEDEIDFVYPYEVYFGMDGNAE